MEVFRHWFMLELLHLRNFHHRPQQSQHTSDNSLLDELREHDAIVKVDNGLATFIAQHRPIDATRDTADVRNDATLLCQGARSQYGKRTGNDALPQIVVTMQCYGRNVEVRAITSCVGSQLVAMPIVVSYQMPAQADNGAAQLDVAEWLRFLDALLAVVPYAVQLQLKQRNPVANAVSTPSKVSSLLLCFRCGVEFSE